MSNINIFEQASRAKLVFQTNKGAVSVEQLWDLPLTSKSGLSLDALAIGLNQAIKEVAEVKSFVDNTPLKGTSEMQLRFDIVMRIIEVRKEENAVKLETADRADKKRKLQALIAQKQDQALEGATLAELQAQLDAL